jgi:hypothetical protein
VCTEQSSCAVYILSFLVCDRLFTFLIAIIYLLTTFYNFSSRLFDVNVDGARRVVGATTRSVTDDLMNEVNQNVCSIFAKLSHHRNVSVILLTQNLFHRNKHVRTMNLNTHYIVLFKNPRDAGQVSPLARQMHSGKSKFVVEAYEDATKERNGYC